MKLKYVGPFDAVEIPELGIEVERNHQFEAVGKQAEALLAQGDNFTKVAEPKPRKPKDKGAQGEPENKTSEGV